MTAALEGTPPTPVVVGRRRWIAVAVAAVCAVAVVWWLTGQRAQGQGPLADTSGNSSLSSGPMLPNQWAVAGLATGRLLGTQPAVLLAVSPLDPTGLRGLTFRYAYRPDTTSMPGLVRGWPPDHQPLLPVQGAVVQPSHEARIIVGVKSSLLHHHFIVPGFTVTYRIGTDTFTMILHQGIGVRIVSYIAPPTCVRVKGCAALLRRASPPPTG